MCGRFAQVIKHDQLKKLIDELDIKNRSEQIELNYNLAPTQACSAIINNKQENLLSYFRWGLIPSWSKEIPSYALINVRSDTILEKPSFKNGLTYRRCIVPATGFYEWRKPDKLPFFIYPREGDYFFFAGIFDHYTAPDGSEIPSLALITTEANPSMAAIHNRMPVILTTKDMPTWLNSSFRDSASLQAMLNPCPDALLALHPVSRMVNSPQNNSPECMYQINE